MFMKTSTKVTKETEKKGSELTESFVLWLNKSKAGSDYLTGKLNDKLGSGKLVGYFNTNKKNPKEPDIRIYTLDTENKIDKEIADLWDSVSETTGNEYLTGTSDEQERLIGFYGEKNAKTPYIRVYFKN